MKIKNLKEKTIQGDGWLKRRFGDCFAQISTNTKLRVKSSIKDVHRVLHGHVSAEIEILCKKLPLPPQGIDDADFVFGYENADGDFVPGAAETDPTLKGYIEKYPKEWAIVKSCLGLNRGKSRHASAFVIADEPIHNFIPLMRIGDVRVTQYTAPAVEAAGGLKMDFLVVNSLNDIEKCVRLIQDRSGCGVDFSVARHTIPDGDPVPSMTIDGKTVPYIRIVPHKGKFFDIWNLPEDQLVFREICEGKTETVFQLNTASARQWLREFVGSDGSHALRSVADLAAFTALDRPGPLDANVTDGHVKRNMLQEYAARARGETPIGANPLLDKMLPETYGVMCFQEQTSKIFQELGDTTGIQANKFREHTSKKKMAEVMKDKALFMEGAVRKLGQEEADRVWNMLEKFAGYGFNKSHAVCYVTISYACAWLKYNYPLEWWTAVLSHADRNEIDTKFWQYCGHLIDMPDIKLSADNFAIQGDRIRAPLSLLGGVGASAHEELVAIRPVDGVRDFIQKIHDLKTSKTYIDPETGKKKSGRSALNSTIMLKLIVSGAADSLFPPDSSLLEKLELYTSIESEVTGKKNKKFKIDLTNLTPLQRFQLRKDVLPMWSQDLRDAVKRIELPSCLMVVKDNLFYDAPRPFGRGGATKFRCVSGKDLRELMDFELTQTPMKRAVIAYVVDTRPFTYRGNKKACEISFDVNGERFGMVKWPDQEGNLDIPNPLKGAVCCITVSTFKDNKWSIDDIEVLQVPFDMKTEGSK